MLRFAIDIGGTFTDVVAQTESSLESIKVLTQPLQPEAGALDGMERLLAKLGKSTTDITTIIHGTTLATNALIERRGAKTALITTAGFRDVIEMRYEKRFDQYALNIEMPEPLVPRPLRLGLAERVLADGSIHTAPSTSEINKLVDIIRQQKVEAVAIGFLHAYKNPVHEIHVAKCLAEQLDDHVTICQSAEVAGEIREYERFSTVCANAYVRPLMAGYLDHLERHLRNKGFSGSFLMMLSDGGLTTLDKAMRFPIRLIEGGPAGGVALGAHVANEVGSTKTLALDIGGTTAKICFIENGTPRTARRFEIARAWRGVKGSGLPVRVPSVELVEIGAGGGSIATVDTLGRLTVGPKSASAMPGPAAYNQGGDQATITDAHLTVGSLSAEGFAGGILELKPELAPEVITQHIQTPLDFDNVEPAAAGIIELADEAMANAARVHGIELGLDVSSFDLLVSGGGGGLHGARIAEKLGIRRVIVPDNSGVGSAIGFLHSPVAFESAISIAETVDDLDVDELTRRVSKAIEFVRGVVAESIPEKQIDTTIKAEVRYQGQGLELTSHLDNAHNLASALPLIEQDFCTQYRALFGYTLPHIPVELVAFSISAKERREINLEGLEEPVEPEEPKEPKEDRPCIGANRIDGPAVVTEPQTTTLVRPGWAAQCSTAGHLLIERAE